MIEPDKKLIVCFAGYATGGASDIDGSYYVGHRFGKPVVPWSRVEIETTNDPEKAKRFGSLQAVMAWWKTVDKRIPVRPDGKPNRPFIAYNIMTQTLEAARKNERVFSAAVIGSGLS